MTVPVDETGQSTHVGNGTTDTYDYEYKITSAEDLTVSLIDASGNVTVLSYASGDYTVAGVGDDDGGSITLTAGNLATGVTLLIEDEPDISQTRPFGRQGAFFGSLHENAFDLLTRLIRKVDRADDRTLTYPATGGNFDAQNKQIDNLLAGTASGDATNLAQVNALIAAALYLGQAGGNWDAENLLIKNLGSAAEGTDAVNQNDVGTLVPNIIATLSGMTVPSPVTIPRVDSSGNVVSAWTLAANTTYLLERRSTSLNLTLPKNPAHGTHIRVINPLGSINFSGSTLDILVDPSGNDIICPQDYWFRAQDISGNALTDSSGNAQNPTDSSGNYLVGAHGRVMANQVTSTPAWELGSGWYSNLLLINTEATDSSGNLTYKRANVIGAVVPGAGGEDQWQFDAALDVVPNHALFMGYSQVELDDNMQWNELILYFDSTYNIAAPDASGNATAGRWRYSLIDGQGRAAQPYGFPANIEAQPLTSPSRYSVIGNPSYSWAITNANYFMENFLQHLDSFLISCRSPSPQEFSTTAFNLASAFNGLRLMYFTGSSAAVATLTRLCNGGIPFFFNAGTADVTLTHGLNSQGYGPTGLVHFSKRNLDQTVTTTENLVVPPGEWAIVFRERHDYDEHLLPGYSSPAHIIASDGVYRVDSSGNPITLQLDSSGNPAAADTVQISGGVLALPAGSGPYFVQAETGTTDSVTSITGGGVGSEVTLLGYPGHVITFTDTPGTLEAAGSPTLTGSNWDVLKMLNVAGRWIKSGYETN